MRAFFCSSWRPLLLASGCAVYPFDVMVNSHWHAGAIAYYSEQRPDYQYVVEMWEHKNNKPNDMSDYGTDTPELRATVAQILLVKYRHVCKSTAVVREEPFGNQEAR
jgi:hypothetical protein